VFFTTHSLHYKNLFENLFRIYLILLHERSSAAISRWKVIVDRLMFHISKISHDQAMKD